MSSGKTTDLEKRAAIVDAVMSAAAVLVLLLLLLLLLLPLLVLEVEGDDIVVGAGAIENKVRSGVRSNSYEQKKRPMYGAVPSSAAARP